MTEHNDELEDRIWDLEDEVLHLKDVIRDIAKHPRDARQLAERAIEQWEQVRR